MAGTRFLLAVVAAAFAASTALAAGPDPAAQCATHYDVGTPQYNSCVAAAGTPQGQTPPVINSSSSTLTASQQAAIAACKGKGLVENSQPYMDCIKDQTSVTAAPSDPKAAV